MADRDQNAEPVAKAARAPIALRVASYAFRGGVLVVALAIGAGITGLLVSTAEKPAHVEGAARPTHVLVRPLRRAVLPRVFEGYGTASAMHEADVAAQVTGRVVERPESIEPGVVVRAGEVLVEIETIDYEAGVEAETQRIEATRAEIGALEIESESIDEQIALMRDELDVEQRLLLRASDALERGGGSAVEVENRTSGLRRMERLLSELAQRKRLIPSRRATLNATLANQRAALRVAEENLARCTVRAPIDGVLQRVDAEPGELLTPGSPVARVVDLSLIEVPLRLGVSAARLVRVGDEVELRADSVAPTTWSGRVSRIEPESDPGTRTVGVFVEVRQDASAEDLLRPGQFVVGRVSTGNSAERWVAPRRAVKGDEVLVAAPTSTGWVIERLPVRIAYFVEGELHGADPFERQWAVLEPGSVDERDSDEILVIVTNLDELRAGDRVDFGERGADDETAPAGRPE